MDKVRYVSEQSNTTYMFHEDILLFSVIFLFRDYYLVTIMLYREYPEKSFKSFSLLANALPIGIPAEGLGLGILQPEIGILQPDRCSSSS